MSQTLGDTGTISLTLSETYLEATATEQPSPVAITLPDGTYQGQVKMIILRGDPATTATFVVTGTFKGFNTLTFDGTSFSALLKWDGAYWVRIDTATAS